MNLQDTGRWQVETAQANPPPHPGPSSNQGAAAPEAIASSHNREEAEESQKGKGKRPSGEGAEARNNATGKAQGHFSRRIEMNPTEEENGPLGRTTIIEIGKAQTTTGGVIHRMPVKDITMGIKGDKWEITALKEDTDKSAKRTRHRQVERIM